LLKKRIASRDGEYKLRQQRKTAAAKKSAAVADSAAVLLIEEINRRPVSGILSTKQLMSSLSLSKNQQTAVNRWK
jgi:hypothetical protein